MGANLTIANIIFIIGMLFLILTSAKTTVDLISGVIDNTTTKSRLKQFNKGVKKDDKSNFETIEGLTESIRVKWFPKLQKFMPSLQIDNLELLEKQIKFIGWDDTFTAESYIATNIALKIVGAVLFLVCASMGGTEMIIAGLILLAGCIFALDGMFKGEVKNKNNLLFADFPELIRIISGYLTAGMDLVRSIEESIKYVSDEWKPILNQFILDCNTKGVTIALDGLRDSVDMFEVREFVSLVKLTLEQGGEAKESFAAQADRVAEMQKNQFLIKIGKRKTMASMVQGPMLLCNMIVIALPTLVGSLGSLGL
jgi:Flp pilus assembly protein TadB